MYVCVCFKRRVTAVDIVSTVNQNRKQKKRTQRGFICSEGIEGGVGAERENEQ